MEPIKLTVKFGHPKEATLEELRAVYKTAKSKDLTDYSKRDLFIEDEHCNVVYHDPKAIIHNGMDVERVSTGGLKDALCVEDKIVAAIKKKLISSTKDESEKLKIEDAVIDSLFEVEQIHIV